ncbi:MAG: hypothetical protein L0241_25400 [Planctomycetia bacterium]|nr:hypothetical protein [Planctomycetia bacterium]
MSRTLIGFAGCFVLAVLNAPALAQETVDNPQYQEWAKWKEGAFVTIKSESSVDGKVQVVTTQTQTLKKLTAEKAVVEITGVTEAAGQTIKAPPVTFDFVAKLPKVKVDPKGIPEPDPKAVPKFKETKGREALTINGKKVECEWIQIEFDGFSSKTWMSNQIPGRMVKSETKTKESVTTMQLTDWKAEKK